MELIRLTLNNFQGIKHFVFEPNGMNASVYGNNAVGKTTLFNAFTWLLFDKASTGEKGFSPKTKDEQGDDIHYIENSVEGVFKLDNGSIKTFKKVLREDWTKKRGSIEEKFTGHKTDYYDDGIPILKCDYDSRLKAIFTPLQAQVLTQPTYFSQILSWQDRRKLLLEVCGNITDEEVIEGNKGKLGDLPSTLLIPGTTDRFYSVEEYRKIAASQCNKLNNEIKTIPDRVDEAKRAMPDVTKLDKATINASIDVLKKQKGELEEEKAAVSSSSAVQAIRKEIADLQIEIIQKKSDFLKKHELDTQSERKKISDLEISLTQHKSNKRSEEITLEILKNSLENTKNERETFNTEYKALKDKEWQGDTVCPTCGQAFPAEEIEAVKETFNLDKAKRLEEIRSAVSTKCSKIIIAKLEQQIIEKQDEIAEIDGAISHISVTVEKAKATLPDAPEWERSAEYADCSARMDELKRKLYDGDSNTAEQKKALQAKIAVLQGRIDEQNTLLYKLRNAEKQEQRIGELEKQEKRLAKEYEIYQQGLYLCEEFVRAKVSMLDNKINSRFSTVKFKLFNDQINGGLKECCEVMVPGESGLVNYGSANSAGKINAGLEIIDTLSNYWGISMPVFVDNAEGVVTLQPIASQVIRLVVSEKDKKLRMEVQ